MALTLIMSMGAMQLAANAASEPAAVVSAAQKSNMAIHNSMGMNQTEHMRIGDVEINVYSGNVFFNEWFGMGLSYNSLASTQNNFGDHFTSSTLTKLTPLADGSYEYIDDYGTVSHFVKNPDNRYFDENYRELEVSDYGYNVVISSISRGTYAFDTQFRPTAIYSRNPYSVNATMYYDQYGTLAAINDNAVIWGPDGILSYNGTSYHYNANGNLDRIDMADGSSISYEYDSTGNYIKRIGNTEITYDEQGRATNVKVYDASQNLTDNVSFLYGNNQTVVIDKNGIMTLKNFDADGFPIA